jgi:hypothetical protein
VLFGVRWRSGWEGVAIAIVVLSTAHAGTEYLGKSGRDGSVTNRTLVEVKVIGMKWVEF